MKTKNQAFVLKKTKDFTFFMHQLEKNKTKLNFLLNKKLISFSFCLLLNFKTNQEAKKIIQDKNDQLLEFYSQQLLNTKFMGFIHQWKLKPLSPINKQLEQMIKDNCFFISQLFLDNQKDQNVFCEILYHGWIYLIYNDFDCQIFLNPIKNLTDANYEDKVKMISNNIHFFIGTKQLILNHFQTNVNDLITCLIGLSNQMQK